MDFWIHSYDATQWIVYGELHEVSTAKLRLKYIVFQPTKKEIKSCFLVFPTLLLSQDGFRLVDRCFFVFKLLRCTCMNNDVKRFSRVLRIVLNSPGAGEGGGTL